MRKRKLKRLPKFESEQKERDFWATHDSMDYIDWSKAEQVVFPNLKPTARKKAGMPANKIVDRTASS